MNYSILGLLLLCFSIPSHALNIFACEAEWASLAQTLAPDATVYTAVKIHQDPHFMQAKPSLLAQFRQADFAICTGAELEEAWLGIVIRKARNTKMHDTQGALFYAAEQIDLINQVEKVDRAMGDIHAAGNPHVYTSPIHMLAIAEQLGKRFAKVDPERAHAYLENTARFTAALRENIKQWEVAAARLKGKKVVIAHTDFLYFYQWLGLEVIGDIEPKPGIPPTTAHLANLKTVIDAQKPYAIVTNTLHSDKGAQWLHYHTHVPVITLAHTVGAKDAASDTIPNTLIAFYDAAIQAMLSQH